MAAETSYSGGTGGKFRKRPFRRPASTPYDRPPTAVRPALRAINPEGERNGFISRLIDSAPRMLVSAASKFFSSVKRLGAPQPTHTPDAGAEAREEATIPDPLGVPNESASDNPCTETPNTDGISDLENLLQQKTFTRAQFDQLTELLRSRTITSPESKQPEENISLQISEKRIKDPSFFGSDSKSIVEVSEKEIASPAELAKAYMVSRPSKLSTPITGIQSPAFRESTPLPSNRPPLPKPSDLAVVPRSMIRLSGLSENGYKTPRSQGRSAIYKMSRSPYFKAQSLVPAQGIEPMEQSHARASNSQLVPSDGSDGKQVLKRRSSFVENDTGSFGPIRRIRQKSNWITPEKEVTEKYISTPNNMHASMASIRKPLLMDALSHSSSGLGAAGLSSEGFASAPRKSVQMATKIFQQLDLLGSPPKERAYEQKSVIKDEAPLKLSISMLHGKALASLKDIGASKVLSLEDNNHCSSSNAKDHSISTSPKVPSVENNGRSSSAVGTKYAVPPDGPIVAATAVSQGRPGFKMEVPEISSDGDVENQGGNDTPNILNTGMEPSAQVSTSVTNPKISPVLSSRTKSTADLAPIAGSEKKPKFPRVPGEDNGFSFPVASSKSSLSQPPPTPTMLSPVTSKDEGSEPLFSFGSGKVTSLTFSSVTSDPNADTISGSKADLFVSTSSTRTTQLELPKFTKGKDAEKIGGSLKPFQSSASSISFGGTSPSFTFGGSASGLSNGSLKPVSSLFSASASTEAMPINGASLSSAHNTSSSPSTALISVTATSSTTTSVGSSTAVFTDTVAPVITKIAPQGLEVQSSKDSAYSTNNQLAATTSAAVASSVTSIFGSSSAASASTPGTTSVQLFSSETTKSGNGISSIFVQGTSNAFSTGASSVPGSSVTTPAFGFAASGFGSSTSASPFSFGLSSGSGQDTSASFPGQFSTPSTSLTTSLFSSSATSASSMVASTLFSASSGSSLSTSITAPSIFGSGSQPATSTIFGSGATSSSFSFGQSPTVSGASSFSFGSSGTTFSFTSAPSNTATAPVSPAPMFGTPGAAFGSGSPANDQMNVEDSMADDTVQSQTTMPVGPTFNPAANTTTPSTFSFGSPQPSGSVPFQFGGQQSAVFPQAQSPFQPTGNLEFGVSGSFSLGSGGGDKSTRKMIRVRKDNKNRKK